MNLLNVINTQTFSELIHERLCLGLDCVEDRLNPLWKNLSLACGQRILAKCAGIRHSRCHLMLSLCLAWTQLGRALQRTLVRGVARTILLFHIISARPSKQPLRVRTSLKVYMELAS